MPVVVLDHFVRFQVPALDQLVLSHREHVRVPVADGDPSHGADVARQRQLELSRCKIPNLQCPIPCSSHKPLVSRFHADATNPSQMSRDHAHQLPRRMPIRLGHHRASSSCPHSQSLARPLWLVQRNLHSPGGLAPRRLLPSSLCRLCVLVYLGDRLRLEVRLRLRIFCLRHSGNQGLVRLRSRLFLSQRCCGRCGWRQILHDVILVASFDSDFELPRPFELVQTCAMVCCKHFVRALRVEEHLLFDGQHCNWPCRVRALLFCCGRHGKISLHFRL
mmetsp:Transcript_10937/g.26268  ORF Transcript_10937/g.26268 Transcript_10937/m.26268 type:complete len:276 (-) Transcript_10937:101-928(-)